MNYGKKVLVLSQVAEGFSLADKRISAIVRIESDGGVSTLYLSAVNAAVKDDGRYILYIMDGRKKLYSFSLGKRPTSFTKEFDFPREITDGFAAGISYVEDGIPVLVAYSDCDSFRIEKSEFKKAIIAKCMTDLKKEPTETRGEKYEKIAATTETFESESLIGTLPPEITAAYNDEAVATENYYLLDEDLNEKLKIIESMENVRNKNLLRDNESEKRTEKGETDDSGDKFKNRNEERGSFSETRPYIDTARAELENMFFKFPEEKSLSKIIPESRWVRINYSAEKYYVVGIVKENGAEKYICYGVPAKYSAKPPKELKGFCSFVPKSYFDMKGDGFWMMFQSAITGGSVKPKE